MSEDAISKLSQTTWEQSRTISKLVRHIDELALTPMANGLCHEGEPTTAIVSLQASFKGPMLRLDLVVQGAERLPASLVKTMSDALVAGLATSLQSPGLDSLRTSIRCTLSDPASPLQTQNLDGVQTK